MAGIGGSGGLLALHLAIEHVLLSQCRRRRGLECGNSAWVERIGDIRVVGQRPQGAQDVIVAKVSAPGIVGEANAAGLAEGEPGRLDRAERRLAINRCSEAGAIRLGPISG
jgi:hypothetical protein